MNSLARVVTVLIAGGALAGLAACSTTATTSATSGSNAWTGEKAAPATASRYQETLDRMINKDPGIKRFLGSSYGYAVFPTVGKGALIVGGAYGEGAAFRQGELVAHCTIAKGSIGFQIGGKAYSEVIFFKTRPYFDDFVNGNFSFTTGVSAVAVTTGAAANVTYSNGVAVFTLPKGGLMAAAAVSGQNFDCTPAGRGTKTQTAPAR
ncbi:MAG: hypothetical protein L0I62_02520 [Gammaproteobacteria bacterium]|nr:hypothetical protein [Gammaproteobacteria bacterium]